MRLMIAEKHQQACQVIETGLVPQDTHIVLTVGFGLWRYTLPRLTFKDIPYTQNPCNIEPRFNFLVPRLVFTPDMTTLVGTKKENAYPSTNKTAQLNEMLALLTNYIDSYEEIIVCVDNDRSGMWSAKQLIEQLPQEKLPPIHCMKLVSMDKQAVSQSWHSRTLHRWGENCFGEQLAHEHAVKKHFDYWWYCNAMLVFSELLRNIGLPNNMLMSKYEMMLVAIVSQKETPVHYCKLLKLMTEWEGTGKYDSKHLASVIGSAASHTAIIDKTIERGLLQVVQNEPDMMTITEQGQQFISLLHPRTFDPDLPFRLDRWCAELDYASPQRYIRTLFGRQLRYQRKQTALSSPR